MKKIGFGILVILLAIGAFALTNTKKTKLTTVLFCFVGNPHSEADVENPANWVECSGHNCDDVNEVACAIEVDEMYTQGNPRTLIPGFSIIAEYHSGCNTFYVVGGDMIRIINRSCSHP